MSTRKSLLLVDSDARSLRVLEVSLRKAGFSVNTAESAGSALQWAFTEPPDLVITDTRLPDASGFELCQRLRSDARTRLAVVVFLTEEAGPDSKIAGINAGADDFLTKPVLVKEIVSRVRTLLETRRTDSIARRERPGNLSGTLANMGVVDLLQVMEAGGKSGIVHISSDPIKSGGFVTEGEERGTIFFRDGAVIDAKLGRLSGLEAVYRMLLWDDGVFEIEFKNIAREDAINSSTQTILLEGMRRVDEWSRFSDLIPAVNSRLTIDYNAMARSYPEGVPAEMKPVMHLFDGRRSIFEVVSDTPGDDAIALNVIADLHRYGILQAAHREASENAVEAWLSSPPVLATDPGLPSALANAMIPSPRSASQILGPGDISGEPTLVGQQAYVRRGETQRLPIPIPAEPSHVLSRHTVPANKAVPLTHALEAAPPDPIPLTQTRPPLRIQRVSSVVGRLPTASAGPALAEAPHLELEEEDDGWEPIRTAPSPARAHSRQAPPAQSFAAKIPAAKSGSYVIAPAAAPPWPVTQPKHIPISEEVTDELEDIGADEDTDAGATPTKPPPAETPLPIAVAPRNDFEKASDTSEWYSKSEGNDEVAWESTNVWKQRLPGILLAASVAAVLAVLLMGNPKHEDEVSGETAQASQDPKRATWPKTDETAIVIKSAVPQQPPPAAVEPPAVTPPAAVAPVAVTPAPPEVAKVVPAVTPPPVAPPVVEKPKIDKAAAEEAAKAAEGALAKGSLNAAKAGFDKAIAADPENADAHSGLAMVYVELGRDKPARASALSAIKLDANQSRAQLVLALIAANGSDMETAKKYYKKYLQLAPNGKHAEEVRRILKTLE